MFCNATARLRVSQPIARAFFGVISIWIPESALDASPFATAENVLLYICFKPDSFTVSPGSGISGLGYAPLSNTLTVYVQLSALISISLGLISLKLTLSPPKRASISVSSLESITNAPPSSI